MKQAQGQQGEEACQEPHRTWACSQVLWFQTQALHTVLPDSFLARHLKAVAPLASGLRKPITSGCAPQKLLHGCCGSRVGKQGVTWAWQEGFHGQLECCGAVGVPCVSCLQGSQRRFSESVGRSMTDKASWQLGLRRKTNGHRKPQTSAW